MAERYVGRMYQLRGEFDQAIPLLLAARPKLKGTDVVGIDEALVLSYIRTGQPEAARRVAMSGISGEYGALYRQMAGAIPGQ
jgi:hypothetical protein